MLAHQNSTEKTLSSFSDPADKPPASGADSSLVNFKGTTQTALCQVQITHLKALTGLKNFKNGQMITLVDIQREFATLCALDGTTLTPIQRSAIEKYKLDLMQTVEASLRSKKEKMGDKKKPIQWNLLLKSLGYGILFILDIVPMAWGNYIGTVELLEFIPNISFSLITITSSVTGAVEVLLYFAMMRSMVREALGMAPDLETKTIFYTFTQQLNTLKNMGDLLSLEKTKHIKAEDYKAYLDLMKLFNKSLSRLQEHAVYIFDDETDITALKNIPPKAVIIIKDKAYFAEGKQILRGKDDQYISVTHGLSETEKNQLINTCDENNKVFIDEENSALIEKIRRTTLETAGLENPLKINRYHEGPLKKAARGFLWITSLALNVAGSYAFSLFLMGTSAAALMGTPFGWGLLVALVVGQVVLQMLVRNQGLFNLLNPGAVTQKEFRKDINEHEPNEEKYEAVLESKQNSELLEQPIISEKDILTNANTLSQPVTVRYLAANASRFTFASRLENSTAQTALDTLGQNAVPASVLLK